MKMMKVVRAAVRQHRQPSQYTTFSQILHDIGGFGRYQIMLFITVLYSTIVWLSATVFDDFGRINPIYTCANATANESVCDFWYTCKNMTAHSVFKSVVQEWRMNCDDRCGRIREIDIMMDLSGALGSMIGGHIGDNWGRKTWLHSAQVLLCVISVMTTAATTWEAFMVMQILSCFLEQMAFVLACTMVMEITDQRHRLLANLCSRYFMAYTICAISAYFTAEWRKYLIISNFFTAPVLIVYLLVHESPRYLIQRGLYTSASEVLNDIAERWNHKKGIHFTPDKLKTVLRPLHRKFYCFVDLFRHPMFAKVSIMQMVACFSLGLYLHAIDSNTDFFNSVGPFKGFALLGSMQIFSPLFIIFLERYIPKFGRRTMFNLSLLAMIACYATVLARYVQFHDDIFSNWATVGLSLVGYTTATSGYFFSVVLITVEFFPTYIRATALGTFFSMQKLASVILGSHCHSHPHEFVSEPYMVGLGAAAFTLILGCFLQVETRGVHLPDTLQQSIYSATGDEMRKASENWRKASKKVFHRKNKEQEASPTTENRDESNPDGADSDKVVEAL